MKKIKAKIAPDASDGASGVILFEVRQVIWCSYLEIGVLASYFFSFIFFKYSVFNAFSLSRRAISVFK